MASSSNSSCEVYRQELRAAIRHLRDRCLHSAAKWAAEQLLGLDEDHGKSTPLPRQVQRGVGSSSIPRRFSIREGEMFSTPSSGISYVGSPVLVEEDAESDHYLLAKSYFDSREYLRAAHVLRNQAGKKAIFLRGYAQYLAGEKRKEEEVVELEGPFGKGDVVNGKLTSLEKELSLYYRNKSMDSFGLFLYGIVLREKGCEDLARTVLVESVNGYPWNWSAWTELQSLCTSPIILKNISFSLKNHWMKDFFLASLYMELKMFDEGLKKYEHLLGSFLYSDYIQSQIATAKYSLREFDEAEVTFFELLKNDPYRVDAMDVYSNVLYAKESFSQLSHLAHRMFLTDKYRPESCCIIANYYSLKGLHEKAVLYFRRALKLNRKYLSAWTLMGHEYVEMKNIPAAVDAYRRAVDINPRDYRAWYGLGQTYEMMTMPFYALHYFKKAAFLQPTDARMWIALAKCYESEQLHMLDEAIKCYGRAVKNVDAEGIALNRLAKLHNELGHQDEAAYYYQMDLERMEADRREGSNIGEALLFLAKHYEAKGKFEEAELYCNKLLDYPGQETETAQNLLQDLDSSKRGLPLMDIDQQMH